jgi:hypothetical protein
LKATLEKGPTERWIIGSNDVATIIDSWSHGRRPTDAAGNVISTNALEPCVAWKNETLLKFVYVNLGRTVEHETLRVIAFAKELKKTQTTQSGSSSFKG